MSLLVGVYQAFIAAEPLYRSTAVVMLLPNQTEFVDLQSVVGGLSGDTVEVNSEVEVLRARSLIGQVVDELDLMSDPEFNAQLKPANRSQKLNPTDTQSKASDQSSDANEEATDSEHVRDAVITRVLKAVSVRTVPNSFVFRVTVETHQPEKSAHIADTIVSLYIRNQIEMKFRATEQATQWLRTRVSELQLSLERAETRVAEFSASTDLVSIERKLGLERQLKELRDKIAIAENTLTELRDKRAALKAADTNEDRAAASKDPELERLLYIIERDPAYQSRFDMLYNGIVSQIAEDARRVERRLTTLRESEVQLSTDLETQSADLIKLQQLRREAEATRVLYEHFLTRFNETSAQQGIQQADSRILSKAVVPTSPSEPRKSLILSMAGVLGALIGVAIALVREASSNTFRTAADLERATEHTVLGQVPYISTQSLRNMLGSLNDYSMSAIAEAHRNLRTSLFLSHYDNAPKVIVMTSSVPDEGKTVNAIALANSLAGLEKKVLLMEGDLRRRTLTGYFDIVSSHGLMSVLEKKATVKDAVFRAPGLDLDFLSGEQTKKNAADVFASRRFKEFIVEAREMYDVIIIDSPPTLLVPDARILAEYADALLFTVRWNKTTKSQVAESLRLFHTSGIRITGMVLSQINSKSFGSYYDPEQY